MQFKDWMEHALYDREHGYYSKRLKSAPDYITAPNFGPYLGNAVSRELARAWKLLPNLISPKVFTLVEVGCGAQPHLTKAILDTWAAEEPQLFSKTQVILVDRSAARLDRAVSTLSAAYPDRVFGCPDISQIPKVNGAIISNELIDAMSTRLIRKTASDTVEEAYVDASGSGALNWQISQDPVVVSMGLELPSSEAAYALNQDALRYLETVYSRLEHGLVLTIDFGDIRPALFDRSPVKAFSAGSVKEPNWTAPGSEDITSPVDFSMLMDWGTRLGMETIQYETLTEFLIHNGIQDFLKPPDNREAVEGNLKVKTLLHPHGFGDDFKVLLQGK